MVNAFDRQALRELETGSLLATLLAIARRSLLFGSVLLRFIGNLGIPLAVQRLRLKQQLLVRRWNETLTARRKERLFEKGHLFGQLPQLLLQGSNRCLLLNAGAPEMFVLALQVLVLATELIVLVTKLFEAV